ncbi:MAG TPA: endonuclease MutS2 [Longimicrobiales bacterium]|nr:endonuclease MutS2 [Longimicrobiales bacterium]
MNRHAFQVLQLPAALDVVAGRATSELGAAAVRALEPDDDPTRIAAELGRVDAMMRFVLATEGWAVPGIPDLGGELRRLAKPGSVWDARTLLEAGRLLRASAGTRDALRPHLDDLPPLRPLADRMVVLDSEARSIERTVDDAGDVRDDATPALARTRRELRAQRGAIVQRLERFMAGLPDSLRVPDASVTLREGRYVIPIRREGRVQVGGLVHDESATGTTLFVEPPLALELMNRLRELELAEAREVHRILAERTDALRPHATDLHESLEALVAFDSLHARARYAREHGAEPPSLGARDEGYEVVNGRHPLLLAKEGGAVPFALRMDPEERTLVVSGPNTGGKTVLLKAIGLISLMTQAGVVPPVGKGTRLPIFRNVFADIGDEQSIEASLSTFSAHLANLKEIVEEADGASLVLIDEVGSGTDPAEGGALARAILVELTRRGTLTVATSHLGQLKLLAGEEAGVVNASLQFDPERLEPTYRLLKGIPGRSYGLAIARRLGFDSAVLAEAESLLPRGERDVSQLLLELEEKEQELRTATERAAVERAAAAAARADADALREEMEQRRREVQRREGDAERRARQQARDLLLNARRDVEAAIAELRQAVGRGADAAAFDAAATAARRQLEESANRQRERAPERREERHRPPGLAPGMPVRIAASGTRGTVVEVRDGRATVDANGLRMDVKVADLEPVDRDRPEEREGGAAGTRVAGGGGWAGPDVNASPEIHLRGMRAEDVAAALYPALDAAIQAGLPSLRIVHGKGEGILRQVVAELLNGEPRVRSHRPGGVGEGGAGVTVAELE